MYFLYIDDLTTDMFTAVNHITTLCLTNIENKKSRLIANRIVLNTKSYVISISVDCY